MTKFLLRSIIFGIIANVAVELTTAENPEPTVTTPLGDIKGSILNTVRGKPIYSFRGIRYAKPPVDDLRFKPPVPVEKWGDVYDATQDGPVCPQPKLTPTSEDCLFVNVYTTKLPEDGENLKRPVLVFIHFGGYVLFTGSSAWIGPEYMLDQEDIILVTMNYRLGALGFLNTGDELAPGNNGVKDQVLALKWVQQNIAAFGGDPSCVTLSGASVGGVSVTLHLISPMSKGLFHRAIAMSGSSYGNWPVETDFSLAQKQARLVGCPDDTSANIINCLKTKPAQEIANSLSGLKAPESNPKGMGVNCETPYTYKVLASVATLELSNDEFGHDPILVWHPVIEPDFGQERFLPDHPVKLVKCGQFAKVPILTGVSTEEFSYLALDLKKNATLLKEMDERFEEVAPISFLYERNTDKSKHMSQELRKLYLGSGPLTESSVEGIGKIYADSIIGFSVNRVATLMAAENPEPVYYYHFSYQGPYSNVYNPETSKPIGVVHLDDLIYLYYNSALFPKFKETDPEYAIVKRSTALWANFVRTGKPIPRPTDELDNVNWEPYTVNGKQYLDMGEKLVMKDNLYADRYGLWEKLLPLPTCKG